MNELWLTMEPTRANRVSANTSRTVSCQYVPNSGGYNLPKTASFRGSLMSKQSVKPKGVVPW